MARNKEMREALVNYQDRSGEPAGRAVGVRFVYEDGVVFYDLFPELYAEILVMMAASGEWTPYEIELERFALSGGEITREMTQKAGKRVVSATIEYSKEKSLMPRWTPVEWKSFHRSHPDFPIDPKYDRKRPLL